MKYHGHEIKKTPMDLGEWDDRKNHIYQIFDKSGQWVADALTIGTAKDFIDSGYDQNYL